MNATVEKLSSNQVKIDFTVSPEEFELGLEKAYNKLKTRVNIPGFRKGKAPRKVIEMHYGESIFYDDAFEALFPDLFEAAVKENDLYPVDRPDIDVQTISGEAGMVFSAKVYVKPEVTLGQYKGVEAERQEPQVTEDDVNAEIERARERVARFVEVTDRPVKLDDQVDIDYEGFCEGVAFEGGQANGHKLVVGSGQFIPGFEDQLVGANIGDELEVNVTFPEAYHAENLAGKPAVFKVKINGIEYKELPALDDEFAKDVSEMDTFAAYKDSIRENLTTAANERSDAAFENEVLEAVAENATVDVPNAMIEEQIDVMMRNMSMRMRSQGLSMEDFLKYTGRSMEEFRASYHDQAKEQVVMRLVIEAVGKAENIQATDEDIEREVNAFAENLKRPADDFKKNLTESDRAYFAESAVVKNTIELLKREAVPVAAKPEEPTEEN